jgi:predicted RNA-binding protein YlqC (UPF0109 family)
MSDVTGDETAEPTDDTPTDDVVDDAADTDTGAPDAAMSRAVLEYLANAIVDEPDGVVVEVEERRNGVELSLHVAPDDMGKIIGRRGRVAQAIRTVVRAAGAKEGIEAQVEIVD